MAGTRAAVLAAALQSVERHGARSVAMADLAAAAGVAKATLYNHFRSRDDVWAALVETEVRALAGRCAGRPPAGALALAARCLSDAPAVRRLAETEPATLAALARPSDTAAWQVARGAVRAALAPDGGGEGGGGGGGGDVPEDAAVDLVLRWLVSHLTAPADRTAAGDAVLERSAVLLVRSLERPQLVPVVAPPAPP